MKSRILIFVSKYCSEILVGCLVYVTLVAKDVIRFLQQLN